MRTALSNWSRTLDDLDGLFKYSWQEDKINFNEETKTLYVDMPGIRKEDISISADKNKLIVKGKTGEREYNNTYTVRYDFDEENITAKYENGVLAITVPVKEKPNKKIAVE